MTLWRGLPDSARSKQDPEEVPWGMTEELLAQVVEEVSIMAAGYERKEPRQVDRPGRPSAAKTRVSSVTGDPSTGIKATGVHGMLAASQMYGAVSVGE